MSSFLFVVVILALVALVFLAKLAKDKSGGDLGFPYIKATLFSAAERSFLGVLDQAVGEQYRVLGKVRIGDVVAVQRGLTKSVRAKAFNRIQAKHFDFVLCRPGDLSVVCVVELNDKSHQEPNRQKRDDFVAGVCKAAGLPFAIFPAKAGYSLQEIRSGLAAVVELPSQRPVESPGNPSVPAPLAAIEPVPTTVATPTCTKCSAPMVLRSSKSTAGKSFWGCSTFPKCRETLPVPTAAGD